MQTTTPTPNGETTEVVPVDEMTHDQLMARVTELRDAGEFTEMQTNRLGSLCVAPCDDCDGRRRQVLNEHQREPEEVPDDLPSENARIAELQARITELEGQLITEIERRQSVENAAEQTEQQLYDEQDAHRDVQRELDAVRDALVAERDQLRGERDRLRSERDELQTKQDHFVEVLHNEADTRGWCTEFDDIMERVGLPRRQRHYTAHISVTLTFQTEPLMARSADALENDIGQEYVASWLRANTHRVNYAGGPTVEEWEIENIEEAEE